MYVAEYSEKPERIQYMPLPDKEMADVWLRENIVESFQGTEEENSNAIMWFVNEVYFRTTYSLDYVTENFDILFDNDGMVSIDNMSSNIVTLQSRITALEELVAKLQN